MFMTDDGKLCFEDNNDASSNGCKLLLEFSKIIEVFVELSFVLSFIETVRISFSNMDWFCSDNGFFVVVKVCTESPCNVFRSDFSEFLDVLCDVFGSDFSEFLDMLK